MIEKRLIANANVDVTGGVMGAALIPAEIIVGSDSIIIPCLPSIKMIIASGCIGKTCLPSGKVIVVARTVVIPCAVASKLVFITGRVEVSG